MRGIDESMPCPSLDDWRAARRLYRALVGASNRDGLLTRAAWRLFALREAFACRCCYLEHTGAEIKHVSKSKYTIAGPARVC